MKDEVLETLRQPEFTGKNRCEACTVFNTITAVVLGAIIARKSKLGALVTVSISAVLIYLRGYLVPGTPTLTKQYLPPSVLQLFGKESKQTAYSGFGSVETQQREKTIGKQTLGSTHNDAASTSSAVADNNESSINQPTEETVDSISPEKFLLKYDIIKPCPNVNDLCLTEAFKNEWYDEIDRIDADTLKAEDAACVVGITEDKDDFQIEHHGGARILQRDDQHIGQWPSQAALVADVTAARVLNSWTNEWASFPIGQKGALLNSLRLFLERCPTTGGEVTMDEETVESCCQSHDVVAVTCEETGERLFEHPVSDLEN